MDIIWRLVQPTSFSDSKAQLFVKIGVCTNREFARKLQTLRARANYIIGYLPPSGRHAFSPVSFSAVIFAFSQRKTAPSTDQTKPERKLISYYTRALVRQPKNMMGHFENSNRREVHNDQWDSTGMKTEKTIFSTNII